MAVVHRDFHLDNIMLHPGRGPVVLDWTSARCGPVATDISRVLVECLRAADLPLGRDAVVEAYRAELESRGAGPYSRDDLARGIRNAALITLEGAVDWAGADKVRAAGSRAAELPRSLMANCIALLRTYQSS